MPEEIAFKVRASLERFMLDARLPSMRAGFIDSIAAFAALLTVWGARFNLTAQPENPDEIAFHIIDSLMPLAIAWREFPPLADAFANGANVLDLGSGAGFPGIVLAAASEARFTLVESRRKRVSFLNTAVHELGLGNVTVDPAYRAESDFDSGFDTTIARAFGPPREFYRIAASALRRDGLAILYANPDQPLMPEHAVASGLGAYQRIPYKVMRRGSTADRILALWRRT